jgi:hypothetical protein
MHRTFERPVLNLFHQFFANRIFVNVNPFCMITFIGPQPVMPAARLKTPVFISVLPAEFPFPECNPLLNRERQIARHTKRVQMIRHQQIISDKARSRLQPRFVQKFVGGFIHQPRNPIFRCHREQNKIGLAQSDMDSAGWIFSADVMLVVCVHLLIRARRSLDPPD